MKIKRQKCKAKHGQCGNYPIRGGIVCRIHGGGAPQVMHRARLRLLELVEPAIAAFARVISSPPGLCETCGRSDEMSTVVRAAEAVLNRTGMGPGHTITVERHEPSALESMTPLELAHRAERLAKEIRQHMPKQLGPVVDVEVIKDEDDANEPTKH